MKTWRDASYNVMEKMNGGSPAGLVETYNQIKTCINKYYTNVNTINNMPLKYYKISIQIKIKTYIHIKG